jgi:caffeoyl-CoA O-methyltransferase
MFHDIPQPVLERMKRLEKLDAQDRDSGLPREKRLRQITPDTGRFLAFMAASSRPGGAWIEIGTSAGYSTLWLALGRRAAAGGKLYTFEILPEKAQLARETFQAAGVEDSVELIEGDARERLEQFKQFRRISFCFLDAEKEVYADCYEAVLPRLLPGGLLIADNAISHAAELRPMLDRALSDPRVDALVLPIGKGQLVCRKL